MRSALLGSRLAFFEFRHSSNSSRKKKSDSEFSEFRGFYVQSRLGAEPWFSELSSERSTGAPAGRAGRGSSGDVLPQFEVSPVLSVRWRFESPFKALRRERALTPTNLFTRLSVICRHSDSPARRRAARRAGGPRLVGGCGIFLSRD
eukprot:7921101-Pyramimonas_sp.AAC.1